MAKKFKDFTFKAVLLAALICNQSIPSRGDDNDFTIPEGNESAVDQWINANLKQHEQRKAEIANGVDVDLDPGVVQAENCSKIITVRQDGSGNFMRITDAINSIPTGNTQRVIIVIGEGTYYEKLKIDRTKPYVTLLGDPKAATKPTISYNGTALVYGTWESATVAVESSYFVAADITFQNTAPRPVIGTPGTQAVALRISGDKAAFYNCNFFGFQDTLCDDVGMHFFKDCLITGTVDFIFGNGRSMYLGCELRSVSDGYAAITAQSRSTESDPGGFSFVQCLINGTGDVYLGRAWRESSRVVFAYTDMKKLVDTKGWDDKGLLDRDRTVYYAEYKCTGPGAASSGRANYARVLSDDQAQPFVNMSYIHARTWLLPPPTLPN